MADTGIQDTADLVKRPRVRVPDTFDRKRSELKRFLLQCDLYIELRDLDFDNKIDKVYFAIALLRGVAADWAEPFTRDKLDYTASKQSLETRTIFDNYNAFKQAIVSIFSNPGEERKAGIELLALKQTILVTAYTAKFQQLNAKAGWEEVKATIYF